MKLTKLHSKLIIMLILSLVVKMAKAQQDPIFTQYMSNPVVINPAYAGSSGNFNLSGIFRKQWIGFEEWSPTTNAISVNSPFLVYNVGLGFTFVNDEIGPVKQNGLYIDYAYHLQFDRGNNLSLGLKAGFNHYHKDLNTLLTHEDEWFPEDISSKFLPNFGVGAYFYKPNKYFLGISVPKLLQNSFADDQYNNELVGKEDRYYFFTGGFVKKVDEVINLKPTILVSYSPNANATIDFALTAIFYDKLWLGASYRAGNAITAMMKIQMTERMQLGYSYDLTNSRLRKYNNGTHEVFISYDFSLRKMRILSPRYTLAPRYF